MSETDDAHQFVYKLSPLERIVKLKHEHRRTWRTLNQTRWMMYLLEEVAELLLALIGLHKDTPDWELQQIAAICWNWLEMREEKYK